MKEIIGIDVGGSTTKIVAIKDGKMLTPQIVRATDPLTSLYGAFGKFTDENEIGLSQIEKIIMTGVGSSFADKPIYGLPCEKANEFECFGRGGLYISGLDEAIVISMGTGTAIVHAKKENGDVKTKYLGGTGVGGGTLLGLSKKMLGMESIEHIEELAKSGALENVDLRISDMSSSGSISLSQSLTAANFGKLSDIASGGDIALGIINMIFEVAAMLGIFAARNAGLSDIVLTGNLSEMAQAKPIFDNLHEIFGVNFIIPENSKFATAIGAALTK
ncbi:MAG: type II pantothenate kinase [Clostridiales bacterium]|nr:type II pantothenate kinase [Clostridiales bacterium]